MKRSGLPAMVERGDTPDPVRLRDPVADVVYLLKGIVVLQGLSLFATLALLMR